MSSPPPNPSPKRKRKEPIGLRVRWGVAGGNPVYYPATGSDAERLKPLHHKDGDLVFVDFRKPRNPGFHKLAHAIGKLAIENIGGWGHLQPHEAVKRLQVEAGVGCDTMMVNMNTIWSDVIEWIEANFGKQMALVLKVACRELGVKQRLVRVKVPRSISYDSMDQEEFHGVVKGICTFISIHYWPTMSAEEIEALADAMQGDLDPAK